MKRGKKINLLSAKMCYENNILGSLFLMRLSGSCFEGIKIREFPFAVDIFISRNIEIRENFLHAKNTCYKVFANFTDFRGEMNLFHL